MPARNDRTAEQVLRARIAGIIGWEGDPDHRWRRYAFASLLPMLAIWGLVSAYATLSPATYTSAWSLILPGAGSGSSVNLESIGQASSTTSSPFASPSLSPKVIYKSIAESPSVRSAAAARLGVPYEAFGQPRIKLIDQTALMLFEIPGGSPEEAQNKAWALHQAFSAELDRLRRDEIEERATAINASIEDAKSSLERARARLLAFQQESDLVSLDQFRELASRLENLRHRQGELGAEIERRGAEAERLMATLGMTPSIANAALALQADPAYAALAAEHASARAHVTDLESRFGPNHPKIVNETARLNAIRLALLGFAESVSSDVAIDARPLLALGDTPARAELFQRLVVGDAELEGLEAERREVRAEIARLEARIADESVEAAELDDLQRDHQIAEAVFSTALARVETGRGDIYASYPLVQILAPPHRPVAPSSPNVKLAVLGGSAGTLLWIMTLALLWIRRPFVRAILKSA